MNDEKKSMRIEIPGVTDRPIGRRIKSESGHSGGDGAETRSAPRTEANQQVLAEDKLRMTLNPKQERPLNSVLQGTVHAAEQRVKLYEDMKSKMARRKAMKNFFDVVMLLLLLAAIVGGYIAWSSHRAKIEAAKTRLRLEAEAEEIRLREENYRVEAEKRERLQREREAIERRKKEEREKELRLAEEARRELRDNEERYHAFKMALKENEFDLFSRSVTNDIQKTGGELCYLLPSGSMPPPFYWVQHSTNGTAKVFKLEASGSREEVPWDAFQSRLHDAEYIVAKGDKVYFRSVRKKPGIGLLDKSSPGDPATAFFGKMAETMDWLKPQYDELTFNIFFSPKGEPKKKIMVENLLFGCRYSLANVREAIEREYPFNASGVSVRRGAKFNRTVKLWNGLTIRKGADGITYVPMTPPPQRPTYEASRSSTYIPGYSTIHRSRIRTYSAGNDMASQWAELQARAMQEDADEKAFYAAQNSVARERAVSEAERRWRDKVDAIFREGTISYGIRKAKLE